MWLGSLLGLGSALSWACANVAIKSASQRFGSWGALVWLQVIGGAIALVAALIVEGAPGPVADVAPHLVIGGAAACAAYGGLFESLRRGQVTTVTPIISSWSLISVAVAVLYDGASLSGLAAIGIGLVVAGNALLARSTAHPNGSQQDRATPPAALAFAAVAALGFGAMVPMIDTIGASVGRLWTIPLVWAVELCLIVPVLWRLDLLEGPPRRAADWFVVARSAVFEVGGFIALSLGLSYASVTVVSPLSSLSTAGSVALGLLLLRERVTRHAVLGAAAASAGVVLVNL